MKKQIKLNFGCGKYVLDGYTNYDYYPYNEKVKFINLEDLPLPFKDDSIDEIRIHSVLEHLNIKPYHFMLELCRILKVGGIVDIVLPYYYPRIEHIRSFHPRWYFAPLIDWHFTKKHFRSSMEDKTLFIQMSIKTSFYRFRCRFPYIILNNRWILKKK